jgi:hypothetical protein
MRWRQEDVIGGGLRCFKALDWLWKDVGREAHYGGRLTEGCRRGLVDSEGLWMRCGGHECGVWMCG